jgi:2-C-methyl-D-erythritol 4-phosphate cytidylyltransferase
MSVDHLGGDRSSAGESKYFSQQLPIMSKLAVILPAAGSSTRFGSDKLRADLCGRPVLRWTVQAFRSLPGIELAEIVLATSNPTLLDLIDDRADISRCDGGATRAHTVRNALAAIHSSAEWVAIHDAARPLVSHALIARVFAAAMAHGAAAPAMPVALTIKQAGETLPSRAERTVPRKHLWAMQTPQIMRRVDLLDAFEQCPIPLDQVTDDVQLLELIGKPVMLVPGEERNLKLTTAMDLKLAELLLRDGPS